ncbi:gamma-glutamyl-gamma-aminobutyrate hydrolase family protein [Brevibacterium linens]|uniref:Putative glutamine amidotransferase n=1 Tax=Brevibacterium linens TaxID=1703 RepID=A0A2H1I2M3_BRELN|nr:gamma-glutamyl-gamma-aminobutyrate hydrolase family protein [Brevibacterium linens]SMX69451.1 putative glutamine amidotransferase [Brevibacterium linens]
MASNDSDPVIAISCYMQRAQWGVWDTEAALIPGDYVRMVAASGGIPVLLPPHGMTPAILDRVDGLLLAGGADVGAEEYGQDPHEATVSHPFRDSSEMMLLAAARQRSLPVLGICRGMQVVNVADGGTLIQHLPESLGHTDYQPAPGVYGEVTVTTEAGSLAREILGEATIAPCYHHQGIDRLGAGLRATGRSPEGLVETIEPDPAVNQTGDPADGGWLFAVQWHPEHDPDDDRVVRALVQAARRHVTGRGTRRAPN